MRHALEHPIEMILTRSQEAAKATEMARLELEAANVQPRLDLLAENEFWTTLVAQKTLWVDEGMSPTDWCGAAPDDVHVYLGE